MAAARRRRRARLDGGEQLGRLGQPADAPLARRAERAGAGLEHGRAARAQRGEVGLRGGCSYIASFIAGATISGRRQASAARGEQVVGLAGGELGERVRGRGRDEEDVGALDELEVARAARAPGAGSPGNAPRSGSGSHSS